MRSFGEIIRHCVPASLKARIPVPLKARARAVLGIEPWPDLAVRHRLFHTPQYKRLRQQAKLFDVRMSYKPVVERGHQASYLIARWFAEVGVRSVFHVGYANGRYLFYLSRVGVACGGTDLPSEETAWTEIPPGALDATTRGRLLRVDFFDLAPAHLRATWKGPDDLPVDVLFSEATFETLLPWRTEGVSVLKYASMRPDELRALMYERFPSKLRELSDCFRNMIFIEPEPGAGGAGEAFAAARALSGYAYSVWAFQPPLDMLFRLSPRHPTRQTVYAYTRDPGLGRALRAYAVPIA